MTERACKNCRCFAPETPETLGEAPWQGECRAKPPRLIKPRRHAPDDRAWRVWPIVHVEDWCDHFKAKETLR